MASFRKMKLIPEDEYMRLLQTPVAKPVEDTRAEITHAPSEDAPAIDDDKAEES